MLVSNESARLVNDSKLQISGQTFIRERIYFSTILFGLGLIAGHYIGMISLLQARTASF